MIKDVPFFPFYAANMSSSRSFRLMSLKERGLLITIMMECWINGGVPSDFEGMAKILGLTIDDVKFSYTTRQSTFFHEEGDQLISKELEGYRKNYLDRREKQRLGGQKGAQNKKDKNARLPKGRPQGEPEGSLSQINSNSFKSNQLVRRELTDKEFDSWLDGEDVSSIANEYLGVRN